MAQKGFVRRWFSDKSYGFVAISGEKDLFLHIHNVQGLKPNSRKDLTNAEIIFLEKRFTERGLQAIVRFIAPIERWTIEHIFDGLYICLKQTTGDPLFPKTEYTYFEISDPGISKAMLWGCSAEFVDQAKVALDLYKDRKEQEALVLETRDRFLREAIAAAESLLEPGKIVVILPKEAPFEACAFYYNEEAKRRFFVSWDNFWANHQRAGENQLFAWFVFDEKSQAFYIRGEYAQAYLSISYQGGGKFLNLAEKKRIFVGDSANFGDSSPAHSEDD